MDVSSSTQSSSTGTKQVDILKKAEDVQKQQIEKIIESAQEQSKEVIAEKTGVGKNLNITG